MWIRNKYRHCLTILTNGFKYYQRGIFLNKNKSIDKTIRGAYNCKSNKNHMGKERIQVVLFYYKKFFICVQFITIQAGCWISSRIGGNLDSGEDINCVFAERKVLLWQKV